MKTYSPAWVASVLYDLMTGFEKADMDREQKISFVYGNAKLSNPDVTREIAEKVVDEMDKRVG